jgi:hypothetical protein
MSMATGRTNTVIHIISFISIKVRRPQPMCGREQQTVYELTVSLRKANSILEQKIMA